MDFEVTVKYICRNFCTKEELDNKTPEELFKEITYGVDNIDLFADNTEMISIKVVDKSEKGK